MNDSLKAALLDLLDRHGWSPEDLHIVQAAAELGMAHERTEIADVIEANWGDCDFHTSVTIKAIADDICETIRTRSK